MPKQYVLKTSPIDKNRLTKTCKQVIDDAKEDRELALELHRFLRRMVDENPQDNAAKNLMVDCLKLAQSAQQNKLKVIDLLIKLEAATAKAESGKESMDSLYSQLEELS